MRTLRRPSGSDGQLNTGFGKDRSKSWRRLYCPGKVRRGLIGVAGAIGRHYFKNVVARGEVVKPLRARAWGKSGAIQAAGERAASLSRGKSERRAGACGQRFGSGLDRRLRRSGIDRPFVRGGLRVRVS